MKARLAITALALSLTACGASNRLKPADNHPLPIAPYGATATPTPNDLLTPSSQARPERNDEELKSSEKRTDDPFDLPPRS